MVPSIAIARHVDGFGSGFVVGKHVVRLYIDGHHIRLHHAAIYSVVDASINACHHPHIHLYGFAVHAFLPYGLHLGTELVPAVERHVEVLGQDGGNGGRELVVHIHIVEVGIAFIRAGLFVELAGVVCLGKLARGGELHLVHNARTSQIANGRSVIGILGLVPCQGDAVIGRHYRRTEVHHIFSEFGLEHHKRTSRWLDEGWVGVVVVGTTAHCHHCPQGHIG